MSSLKSLHKNIQRKEKHHTLVKNNDDIAKTQTAFYQVISNLYLTKKFISILKNLTSFRKPKWLNEMHFDIMNDLSFDYKNYQKLLKETNITPILKKKNLVRDFCEKTKESLYYISEFLPVFDPTRKFSIFWDSFVMLAISFYFIMIPFYIFISNNTLDQNFNFYIVKTVFLYILGFDILKSFFSSYYHKGLIVKNRKKIMLYYIKTNLFIDLLTLGPLIINPILSHLNLNLSLDFDSWYLEIPKLLFFLRYSRFVEISKKLGELVFVDKNIQSALSLVKLIFRIMILSHIFACMWYMIGNSRFYMSNNWIVNNDLNDSEWWMQYLYAYYFVCVTMNTVGFGDISPSNPLEVLFVIVFMFVACGIFAYSLNSIGIIVSDIWKRQNEFAKDLNIINQFMRDKSINFDLTMRVRKYLEYIWNEEKLEEVEQQVIFQYIR